MELLLANLPDSSERQISFIIAQHLSPNRKSVLPHILAKKSKWTVTEALDNQPIQPGMVYVAPSDCDIRVADGKILLSQSPADRLYQPSADVLFSSLAEHFGKNAVAVILSGTGTDGAKGIRAIKAKGGLVIVQKPDTAQYDGMPTAALQTEQVDLILPPEQIGAHICRAFGNADARTENLRDNFTAAQEPLCNHSVDAASFFQDSDIFQKLDELLTEQTAALTPQDCFRIWVAGCAEGEEAYALAMLVQNRLEHGCDNPPTLQVFATDINEEALQIARKGIYPSERLENLPEQLREKFLVRLENGDFEINKNLRAKVLFAKHDLTADPPFSKIDLICCRNVLTCFGKAVQKKVIALLHYALKDGGILLLGKSETVSHAKDYFVFIEPKINILRKRKHFIQSLGYRRLVNPVASRQKKNLFLLKQDHYRDQLLDTFSTVTDHAVLIVNEAQQIIETRGDTSNLLQIPDGALKFDINSLAVPPIRADLKHVLVQAVQTQCRAKLPLRKIMLAGQTLYVRMQAVPLQEPSKQSELYMLLVERFSPEELQQSGICIENSPADEQSLRAVQLEQELASTKQNLQTYIEELEVANEELQSLNEELQVGIEELQSANEELETAYAEIKQINQELERKEADQRKINLLFRAFFENVYQGNILLNSSYKIRLINRRAEELLNAVGICIRQQDNWIAEFPSDVLTHLSALLEQTRKSRQPAREVFTFSSKQSVRYYEFFIGIVPATDGNDEILLTLSITDRTDEKQREAEIFKRDAFLASLIDSDTTFLIRADLQGCYTYANRAFCQKFGYQPENIIGKPYAFTFHSEDVAVLKQKIRQLPDLPAGTVISVELRKPMLSGETIFTEWEFVAIRTPEGEIAEVQGVGRDITDKKRAQLTLEEEHERLEMIIWGGRLGTWDWDVPTGKIRFNERWGEILGFRPEELNFNFKQWQQLIHPDDRPRVLQAIDECLKGNTAFYEVEHRKKTKSGEWKWLIATGRVAARDKKGNPLRVIGTHLDITEKKRTEEAARLSEERNDAVLRTMQEGIVIQDMSGKIISCNRSAEEILGLSCEQLIGRTSLDPRWRAIREDGSPLPGEEHPAMITLRTGEPQSNVLMGIHKPSGELTWIYVNTQLLRYPDSREPYAVFSMFHDVTQRRNAEMALAAAHKRFESIVDSTDGIVWELDFNTFCFTYVSKKAERLLGYDLQEWYQPDFWQNHLHPEDREQVVAYCIACSQRLEPHEFEYRFIAKDGRTVWLRDIVTVVAAEGKPVLLRGIMIDITKQKEMEQVLERLSLVAKRTSNAVIITDDKRRMIWVNEGFTKITGYTLDEVFGKTPRMFQFEGTNRATVDFVNEQLSRQQAVRFEILNRGKYGRIYWLDVEIQPLFDAKGQLTGFIGIQSDITERKKAEERIRRQNEILKEIAFTQSHVLRRPLANILGLLNLIEMEKGVAKIDALYEYYGYLLQSAREADEIIHRIVEQTDQMEAAE